MHYFIASYLYENDFVLIGKILIFLIIIDAHKYLVVIFIPGISFLMYVPVRNDIILEIRPFVMSLKKQWYHYH